MHKSKLESLLFFYDQNQFTTGLSTLSYIREMQTDLLEYQRDFYEMHDLKVKSKFKGYVVGDEKMLLE
jgi:hypothetical protein